MWRWSAGSGSPSGQPKLYKKLGKIKWKFEHAICSYLHFFDLHPDQFQGVEFYICYITRLRKSRRACAIHPMTSVRHALLVRCGIKDGLCCLNCVVVLAHISDFLSGDKGPHGAP